MQRPFDREAPGKWTEEELIGACLEKSQPAWAELVRRYERLVLSIASKRGLTGQDASDLNQLVWTQVYLKLSSVRRGESFKAWLGTLTRNACYHFGLKRRRIRNRETDRYEITDLEVRHAIAPDDLLAQEARVRLRWAVAALPPRSRMLVEQLYFTHPRPTYRQIARTLGVAEGSVSALRERCLKKLLVLLERELAA